MDRKWCLMYPPVESSKHTHTQAHACQFQQFKKKLLYLSRFILKHVCNYIVCAYRRLQTHIHTIAPVWACHTNSSKALHGYAKNNHEIEEIRHFNVCVHLWCAASVSVLRARLFASFSLFLALCRMSRLFWPASTTSFAWGFSFQQVKGESQVQCE